MYRKIVNYICQSMVINRLYNRMENMVISMCLNIVIHILMVSYNHIDDHKTA